MTILVIIIIIIIKKVKIIVTLSIKNTAGALYKSHALQTNQKFIKSSEFQNLQLIQNAHGLRHYLKYLIPVKFDSRIILTHIYIFILKIIASKENSVEHL